MAPKRPRPSYVEGGAGGQAASHSCRREATDAVDRIDGRRKPPPDFALVNATALPVLPALVARWLPDGFRRGGEWIAKNPKRLDRRPGSFCINLRTGRWADFALENARGGDPVSLAAYLFDLSQAEAARRLGEMLGVP